MTTQPLPCEVEELSTLCLFENLTEEQLARLCREGRVERFGLAPYIRKATLPPACSSSSKPPRHDPPGRRG